MILFIAICLLGIFVELFWLILVMRRHMKQTERISNLLANKKWTPYGGKVS